MNTIKNLFSRKWLFATFLVIAAMIVLARLGIWQLDRLEVRRAFNSRVIEQQSASKFTLDENSLAQDLRLMEYRKVSVSGNYLPSDEIILRNQVFEGRVGYQLYTPLLIEGSPQAVLVQRGWIPEEFALPTMRNVFIINGLIHVEGIIRRAETDFGIVLIPDPTLAPTDLRLDAWNNLDLLRIGDQMEISLLDVYIQLEVGEDNSTPPFPVKLTIDLSEGSHLGYAGQWFIFSIILGIGYPFYVKNQLESSEVE